MASELERKQRRKKVIAGSSTILLLLLVVGTVATTVYQADDKPDPNTRTMRSTTKAVKMLCAGTDYKQTCETSLTKFSNTTTSDPKELLKAAVVALIDEASRSFSQSSVFKSNDSRVQDAINDCWEMYYDSKEDLVKTLNRIIDTGLEHLPDQTLNLKNWLSAVHFYQETCVDGFPEGELKNKMRSAMKATKELTSNALAMIGQVSDLLTMLGVPSWSRRLLSVEHRPVMKRGYPSWVSEGDRRLLKEHLNFKLKPNVTVAKDGSGDFGTINEAIRNMPLKYSGRYVIYVKEGIYKEAVNLTSKYVNITMYGDGPKKTIVTGSKNFKDGTKTSHTATFVASGEGFMAIDMGFHNTAGPEKEQAVALRVQSDRSIFINCRMAGYQDTLYAQSHFQFYRGCVITGTIDFVFGDASAVFQNCLFLLRRPLAKQRNIVTAHGRSYSHESTGFVIQHCKIKADRSLKKAEEQKVENYLARPWKAYSRTIFMENQISSYIHPAGYLPWDGDFALKTLYYAEYNNNGEGSNVKARVKWPGFHVIDRKTAEKFTVANFIEGKRWIPSRGAPAHMDLYYR
ncbi:probable pectinesterase/pectinesterase inhibitor 13 [Elaeis guineensis]|uniref:Pectinesterase n=1 Tax=Elaeis guineensis var. tenera TaxID=51953 RepID=A0A6I9S506_ELAGV|nr:pectinesterase [Elaeis guineensis]